MQHDDDVDYDGCIYLVEPEQECKSLYKNEPQGVFSKIGIWQDLLLIQRNLPSQGGFLNVPVSKLDRVAIWYLSQFASVLPSVAAPFAIKHVFRDRIEAVEAKEAEEVADGVAEAFRKCVKDLLG